MQYAKLFIQVFFISILYRQFNNLEPRIDNTTAQS